MRINPVTSQLSVTGRPSQQFPYVKITWLMHTTLMFSGVTRLYGCNRLLANPFLSADPQQVGTAKSHLDQQNGIRNIFFSKVGW